MRNARLKYQLLLSLLLSFTISFSQSFTTRLYTTADGLVDNYIFGVYQDSYGYLWIGTPNGLSRFDGKQFVNYGIRNGLPSLYVDRIYEDHKHRLWIGTRRGIAEFRSDSCYTYPTSDGRIINFVSCFFEPDPRRLWATTDKGIYEFRDGIWNKISFHPRFENAAAGVIFRTPSGLVASYDARIVTRQTTNGSFSDLFTVQQNRPFFNSVYHKGDSLFMTTYSGLKYFDNTKWIDLFQDSLRKKTIYSSYLDNAGRFWFGTKEDGVFGIIPGAMDTTYVHIPLSYHLVSAFLEDKEKNIWVGGFQGLLKIIPAYYNDRSPRNDIHLRSVRNCIATTGNKILVSDDDGKIVLLKSDDTKRSLNTTELHLDLPGDFVDFYSRGKDKRMWLTTRNGDLYILQDANLQKRTSIITAKNEGLRGIAMDTIRNRLWVCGDSVLFTGDQNHLDTFFSSNGRKYVPMPWIVYVDQSTGAVMVQSIDQGVLLITPTGEIRSLDKDFNLSFCSREFGHSPQETVLWTVYQGRYIKKYIWKNGTELIETESISQADGLPDQSILDIQSDREGKLWVATTHGVTVFQKNNHDNWMHMDVEINENGTMPPLSFSKLATDVNDNIWMTTNTRLISFEAKKVSVIPLQTTTVIERVLLFDRPADWMKFTDSVISYRRLPVNPVFAHSQNTLSIAFNGVQLFGSALPEYSYRLLPADTSWSHPTASNIVTFFQLSPGRYQFEVRSRIKGFEWSDPAAFSFTIKKAFWETWWFRLLVILLASAFIVFIFRYRIKQLRTKNEMKTQIRELETKALKAQMNPHFIHNALNSIQSLIINNRSDEASRYISKFAKLLRQVLENADMNIITLDRELYSLQLYVDLEKLRMNMNVDYAEEIDENILTTEVRIPPLILQPFVENALWHGLSTKAGNKCITVSVKEKDQWIICEIIDNGIGRKKAAEAGKAFPEGSLAKAVQITSQRLFDYNDDRNIEPVSFVDLHHDGEASGTAVIIRIRIH